MNIETVKIADILEAEYNPRTITDSNMAGLESSLKKFGLVTNLIINKDGTLISGHQRLKALKKLGYTEVKCYVVDLNKQDEKLLNIQMNSHLIQGEFDELKLSEMVEELKGSADYEALRLTEIEPLDLSAYDFEGFFGGGEDDGAQDNGDLAKLGKDQFIKKIVVNISDVGLATLMKKLDYLGEDPSELYKRLVNEKYAEVLSGE